MMDRPNNGLLNFNWLMDASWPWPLLVFMLL